MPHSAARLWSGGQLLFGALVVGMLGAQFVAFGLQALLIVIIGAITLFYGVFVTLKVIISIAATRAKPWFDMLNNLRLLDDNEVGTYGVLVPMYDEGVEVVTRLVKSLSQLDYPKHKLRVYLLLEAGDATTISALDSVTLPSYFQRVIVPETLPKNKPRACDWVFPDMLDLDYAVIFDAEDRPDRLQLRKAVTAFKHLDQRGMHHVGVLQAELAFWNPDASRVNKFYWAEYSVHFNKTLRGLAQLGLIPPLGGTSNHFRMEALRSVSDYNGERSIRGATNGRFNGKLYKLLGPWDGHNVTEDADLAMRLARKGWLVKMLNSVTFEEAPVKLRIAKNQRTRWLLGFMQTFLVWMQGIFGTIRAVGFWRWFCFELLIGGTPLSLFLNPLTWAATITYTVSRLAGATEITNYMEALFPGAIYYIGMLVAVVGNAFLWAQKLIVPIARQEESENTEPAQRANEHAEHLAIQEYGMVLPLLGTPLWWAFTSIPAWRAVRQLTWLFVAFLFRRDTAAKWEKTPHGSDMAREDTLEGIAHNKQLTTGTTAPSSTTGLPHTEERGEVENI